MKDKLIELLRRAIVPEMMVQPLAEFLLDNGVVLPVRCGECKNLMFSDCYGECGKGYLGVVRPDNFCCYGERRADNGT